MPYLLFGHVIDHKITIIFQAVSWAKSACNDEDEDSDDGKILRAKLGTALHLIRFTTLSMNEFGKFVGLFFPQKFHFPFF